MTGYFLYEVDNRDSGLKLPSCEECGAVVPQDRQGLHARWHEDLNTNLQRAAEGR